VHARNPFSLVICTAGGIFSKQGTTLNFQERSAQLAFEVGLVNPDHVLLRSGADLAQASRFPSLVKRRYPKRFMFDAGSSTFGSSLYWFVCGYLQVSESASLH